MVRLGPTGTFCGSNVLCLTLLLISCDIPLAFADFCPDNGTVLPTSDATTGDAPFAVRACDLNQDGNPDLVTANDASDTLSVLLNHGDGTYAPKARWPVDADANVMSEPVDVACCDVNGDTLIDLISVNHTSDDVSVLLNTGNTQFATATKYTVGEAPFGIVCLNLDGMNGNDLVTNGFTEDALSVLRNNGDGTFAAHVTYPTGDAPNAMARCDVDGDLDDDLVVANLSGKSISIMRNNADGTFTNVGTVDICRAPADCINPFDIACCDFDGINGPDVATSNGIDDSVAVLFNDGAGGFANAAFYDGVDGAYGVTCCDIDGDSDGDVISANLSSDDLAVFTNDGTGVFGAPSFLPVGVDFNADPSSVICANFDGDTDTDLVTSFVDGLTLFANDCGGGICGDGVIDAREACDDGFTDACGSCNATCTASGTGSTCGDGTICPETEQCDDSNSDSGDGCSATCQIEGACETPVVASAGPRFLAITPQPAASDAAARLVVTSPDWPCLMKYVGFGRCVNGDQLCGVDEDCSLGECSNSTSVRCRADTDCPPGGTCVGADTCGPGAPRFIDINNDGFHDGVIATLVPNAEDAPMLTAAEWGTSLNRCSLSVKPCTVDEDCDRGTCDTSGTPCSVSQQSCANACSITQTECSSDGECLGGAKDTCSLTQTCVPIETCVPGKVYVVGPDIVPTTQLSDGTEVPTVYAVQADCGPLTAAASAQMWAWSDADDSGVVNFSDVFLAIRGFQGVYGLGDGVPSALPGTDVSGDVVCRPQLVVNFGDVQRMIKAFQGEMYEEAVGLEPFCSLPCP